MLQSSRGGCMRARNTGGVLFGTLLVLVLSARGDAGQAPPAAPIAPPLVDAAHLRMQPEAAVRDDTQVNVFGDPAQPGLYAYRRRFKAGESTRPHYHDKDRLVTVIKGTWYTGQGDVYEAGKMVPIRTGGVMFHPAGLHHYDCARDGEVIVQIVGIGPVKTVDTERK
jgi:quercetin dioxygenase-like cupin family protein